MQKENVYFDRNFNTKQNYYYYITAVNKTIESRPSSKILAYVRDATPPDFPKLLKANVSTGKVELKWEKVKDKNLFGYKVYMSMDKEKKEWALVTKKAISESFFLHSKAKELSGNFYYYRVTAIDKSFNESAFSNIVKIKLPDVTAPSQPIFNRHNIYPSKIRFTWARTLEKDLDYYNLYTQKGKKLIRLNKKPIISTFFEFRNPEINDFRKFIVTSVDTSGNESKKDEHIIIKGLDVIAPIIKNIKYKIVGKNIEINFVVKDVDYNGFEILRSSGKVKRYTNISSFQKGSFFIDKNIVKGRTYFYMLKVYDKSGNISLSDVKEIKIN